MVFFKRRRLEKIIKKSIEKTADAFSKSTPKLYEHFFYGSFDLAPQNLVIWYLFETDSQLNIAKASGLCEKLKSSTLGNLAAFGYPPEALSTIRSISVEKATMDCGDGSITRQKIQPLQNRGVMVSFTTKEDIDRIANGDYHLYFQ